MQAWQTTLKDAKVYRDENGLPFCIAIIVKLVNGHKSWSWSKELPPHPTDVHPKHLNFQNVMVLISQRVPLGQVLRVRHTAVADV